MRKKINLQFVFIALIATIMTLCLVSYVFLGQLKNEVSQELAQYADILLTTDSVEEYIEQTADDEEEGKIRITIIDSDGKVINDNSINVDMADNHLNRPEVADALMYGKGEAIRMSETLDKNTFYYAFLLEDGKIIRVAKEYESILSIFISAFPIIGAVIVILTIVCVFLAHFFAKSLIAPIEKMANDVENMGDIVTYKEIMPFINTIQKQHEDIVKSSKMRQEFTANVSHELKTPLTAISGYSELIESGMANSEDVIRFAGEIHRNSNRLLTLINDIIKLSQLDSSEIALNLEKVDLYEIAKSCVEMLQVNANNHKVTLNLTGFSAFIDAERVKIEELVYNLCDNAIRYNNENGTVNVIITNKKEGVALTVKDSGIGISKENQERIFERFYRVDKSRSKSTGGTGLGLAIVKHIVAQHNAKIKLESEVGVGTTIEVIFPYAKNKKS